MKSALLNRPCALALEAANQALGARGDSRSNTGLHDFGYRNGSNIVIQFRWGRRELMHLSLRREYLRHQAITAGEYPGGAPVNGASALGAIPAALPKGCDMRPRELARAIGRTGWCDVDGPRQKAAS